MPIKDCQEDNKSGYKWGDEGKCYTYTPNNEGSRRNAKKSAIIQSLTYNEFKEGVPHYTKDGKLYEGPTHKDADGKLMTGGIHTKDSEYLYHEGEFDTIGEITCKNCGWTWKISDGGNDPYICHKCGYDNQENFATIGERGGIKKSDKAPKSDTPNKNPQGEGTAKGSASTQRGAEVTKEVEETLQKKSDDFNEKYKDKLGYGVNLGMLKSVYQRGIGAYNVSHSPAVKSPGQWAQARVNAFLYIVKNGRPENKKYTGDYDLLPKGHPKSDK
jgi:hypothetical protein